MKRYNLHWPAPSLILGSFVFGVAICASHHYFYQSLHGQEVGQHEYNVLGSRRSSQQINLWVGTAFAFIAKAAFAISVTTAFFQLFWTWLNNASAKGRAISLGRIDAAFSSTSNAFTIFHMPLWFQNPLLLLLASTVWFVHHCGRATICTDNH
jgi:hypothetical protein